MRYCSFQRPACIRKEMVYVSACLTMSSRMTSSAQATRTKCSRRTARWDIPFASFKASTNNRWTRPSNSWMSGIIMSIVDFPSSLRYRCLRLVFDQPTASLPRRLSSIVRSLATCSLGLCAEPLLAGARLKFFDCLPPNDEDRQLY